MTNLLQLITDLLQFTINVRKSHHQPQCTLQLVCENCVLSELNFTSLYAGSRIQNVSEQFVLRIHLFF